MKISIFKEELADFLCQTRIIAHLFLLFLYVKYLDDVMDWTVSPPKSYVGALIPVWLSLEVKFSGHKDEAHVLSGWCPYESSPESHALSLHKQTEEKHMEMQREDDCPQTRKRDFTGNWISCHLHLRLPASRAIKKYLLCKHNMAFYHGTMLTHTNRESYAECRPHCSFLEPSFLLSKCSLSHFTFIFLKTGLSACEYLNGKDT